MRKEQKLVDATKSLELSLCTRHVLGAKRKDRKSCAIARCGLEQGNIDDISVDRNVVKVKFKGDAHWTRYQATPTVKAFVAAFDRRTVYQLHSLGMLHIPEEGVKIVLAVPRKAISLAHLRSAKMKETRKKSAEKRKAKSASRPHKAPASVSLEEVRLGQGFNP